MKKYLLALIALWVSACSGPQEREPEIPSQSLIYGLASPLQLGEGRTELPLQDYFLDPALVDSAQVHPALSARLSADRQTLSIEVVQPDKLPVLSEMRVWAEGFSYSILVRKSFKQPVEFHFDPKGQTCAQVALMGDMNNWNPAESPMSVGADGRWSISLMLNPGKYKYRFVIDGVERLDPANRDSMDNNIGGYNSVAYVEQAGAGQAPSLRTLGHADGVLSLLLEGQAPEVFIFWENHRIDPMMVERVGDTLRVRVPSVAKNMERSHLRAWTHAGQSLGNDILVPLGKGEPLRETAQMGAQDKHGQILYFMLVDRFLNGDPSNDKPVDDTLVAPRANYHGGDLAGIIQKIDDGYFKKLGVNTLWLSPIIQNTWRSEVEYPEPNRSFSGYHGYWPISFTQVDQRFGSNELFKQLVEKAHANGLRVLVDFVANHVHREHPVILAHPDWATVDTTPDGRPNIRLFDEMRLTTWFDSFMPSIDYTRPEALEMVTDSALFWVTEMGVDGFRHDATKHIPDAFWRTLTRKLKTQHMAPQQRPLYQVGETFGSRELIGSYVGSGMLDGQFDFSVYFDARAVFSQDANSFELLASSLQETFFYYGSHSLMGNSTGNHDIPRFISFAGGALRYDESSQEAGWEREIEVKDPLGYKRLAQLTAFIMTIPGVPVIYYGDEIGMPGAGDPDNRRPMRFEHLTTYEQHSQEVAEGLVRLRREQMPLVYGDYQELLVSPKQFAYGRSYLGQDVVVVFNKSNQAVELELPTGRLSGHAFQANFEGKVIEQRPQSLKVSIPAYGFEVFTAKVD